MNPYLNQPFVVALDEVSEDLYKLKDRKNEGNIDARSYDIKKELVDNPHWRKRVENAFGNLHNENPSDNYLYKKGYFPLLDWKGITEEVRSGEKFLTDKIKYGYNEQNRLQVSIPSALVEFLRNYISNLIYFDYDFNSPVTYDDMISGKILFRETTYGVAEPDKKYHCKLYLRGDYTPFKGAYQMPDGEALEYPSAGKNEYSYRENPTFKNGEFFILIEFYYKYPVPQIKTPVHKYASISDYKTQLVFVPTFEAMEKYINFQADVVKPVIDEQIGRMKTIKDIGNNSQWQKTLRKMNYLQFEYRMDNFGNIGNIPLAILPKEYSTKTRPLMMMNYMPEVFRFFNKNN
jgi:hypothetical protein